MPAKKAPAKKTTAKKSSNTKTTKNKNVLFRIHRAEREEDGSLKTWVDEFKVEYAPSTTILMALEDIKGHMDGSLTYRRSCRASICGSCGMTINNRSRLACKTKVSDIVNGIPEKNLPPCDVIEIAAQKNQPILKDLAVDISRFYKKVDSITPYVQDGKEAEKDVNKTSFEQVNMVSNCIMCGNCVSDCTSWAQNEDFIGPAALAKAFRFVADPREGDKTKRLKELSEKNGIWDCVRCGMCIDACPKDVAPMEAIMKLRHRAIEAGITNNRGAKHALAFKGDIKTYGVLNEATMLVETVGLAGMLGQVGNAVNMAKKGKIPNPLPFGHVDGLDEVKKIFKELDENPVDVETRAEDTGPGAG